MKARSCILFPRDDDWLVGAVRADGVNWCAVEDEAGVAQHIESSELAKSVWLALPSRDFLAAVVPTDGLPRRGRNLALRYRLEEQIPWAAEEVSASFLSQKDGGEALAVATRSKTLEERVDSLNASGLEVLGASPAILLVVSDLLRDSACDAILIRDQTVEEGEWVSLINVREGQMTGWQLLPAESDEIIARLQKILPTENGRIVTCDLSGELRAAIGGSGAFDVVDAPGTALDRACRQATRVMDREEPVLVDLHGRSDSSQTFQVAMTLLITILAAGCVGELWRMHRYDALRDEYLARSSATFQQLFPGTPVPAGVVSRLTGEARLLRSKAGDESGTSPSHSQSLSPRLAKVLMALNAVDSAIHFDVSDLRMEGSKLIVAGDAAKLGDADVLADAIRATGDWVVEPPRSQLVPTGISFTIESAVP